MGKKVVKKVVKKKVKKAVASPNFSDKSHTNDHIKRTSAPKAVTRNLQRRPSIEDAISQFTTVITEQTSIIEKLKKENQKLKNQIETLKNKPPETKIVYVRKAPSTGPPSRSL